MSLNPGGERLLRGAGRDAGTSFYTEGAAMGPAHWFVVSRLI